MLPAQGTGRLSPPVSPSTDITLVALTGQGRLLKSAWAQFAASTAAGASSELDVSTYDDQLIRIITGIFSSVTTTGGHLQVKSSGKTMFDVDLGAFAAAHGPLACYVPIPANVLTHLTLVNGSGGSVAAPNVTLFYEVYDPNYVIGAR